MKSEESHRRTHAIQASKFEVGKSQPPLPERTPKTVYLRKNLHYENVNGSQGESLMNRSDRFTKESIYTSDFVPKKGKSKRKYATRIFDSAD